MQLYVRDERATMARPVMELKGFQKIELEPGEEREVSFRIDGSMLQMQDSKGAYVVEPGLFRLMIGGSSRELPLKLSLEVKN